MVKSLARFMSHEKTVDNKLPTLVYCMPTVIKTCDQSLSCVRLSSQFLRWWFDWTLRTTNQWCWWIFKTVYFFVIVSVWVMKSLENKMDTECFWRVLMFLVVNILRHLEMSMWTSVHHIIAWKFFNFAIFDHIRNSFKKIN